MKNQVKKKAWACYAVYYGGQFLGYVHAWTETQAWGFVKRWAEANGYRQQYYNQELSLTPNGGCKNDHHSNKLLGAAKGCRGARVDGEIFHLASDAAMSRHKRAQRAFGGD